MRTNTSEWLVTKCKQIDVKMVKTCCVFKCHNRCNSDSKSRGVSFFRFPKDKRQRNSWIKAVNRKDWIPNDNSWICSEHFLGGWHGYEPEDDNYSPTIFSYKEPEKNVLKAARQSRYLVREKSLESLHAEILVKQQHETRKEMSILHHSSYCRPMEVDEIENPDEDAQMSDLDVVDLDVDLPSLKKTVGTQCDNDKMMQENIKLKEELRMAKMELQKEKWGVARIADNDGLTKFYTGLPTFSIFLWLFNFLDDKCSRMSYWTGDSNFNISSDRMRVHTTFLKPIDQLLAILMRNRLGLFVQDISDRFNIAVGTFSKYYYTWICLLHKELNFLNPFPSRDIVQRTMPSQFRNKYPNTRIIIDCTEIFIQRPSSLTNQSLTFSNYKHHNTMKFLVGITPSGVISFVSEGWGGRVSDRQITEESGLLDMLETGDSVMADKGFTISDLLNKKGCSLNIPPFRGQSNQFSVEDVHRTQEIAQLRIHVERSIGRIKNFHIFDGVLPLSMSPIASKIFQVCCWLTNFDVPLVEDK